jgi:hypothetical protein
MFLHVINVLINSQELHNPTLQGYALSAGVSQAEIALTHP